MGNDLRQLEEALLRADEAGDVDSARVLVEEIARRRGSPGITAAETPGKTPNISQSAARSELIEGAKEGGKETVRTGARIVGKAGSIVPLAIDAGRYVVDKLSGRDPPFARATGPYLDFVKEHFGEAPNQGVDAFETVASGGLAGLAGALRSAANASRHFAAGAAGAAGGEAGKILGEPFGMEEVGALIGGAGAGSGVSFKAVQPKLPQLLSDSMKGVSDKEFATAIALRNAARERGVSLTPEQLFDQPTGLNDMMRSTVASGRGVPELETLIRRQPDEVSRLIREESRRLGPRAQRSVGQDFPDSPSLPLPKGALPKGTPEPLALVRGMIGTDKDRTEELATTVRAIQQQATGLRSLAEVFKRNGDDVSYEEALQSARRLENAIPAAFRESWEEAVTRALRPRDGVINPRGGTELADRFLMNEKNTRALLDATFSARGLDPQQAREAADGFMTFLRIIQASGRNRSGFSPGSAEVKSGIGQGVVKSAIQLTQPLAQQSVINRLMTGVNLSTRYNKLSKIFADPLAIEKLRELSQTPLMSARAMQIVSGVLGGASTIPE